MGAHGEAAHRRVRTWSERQDAEREQQRQHGGSQVNHAGDRALEENREYDTDLAVPVGGLTLNEARKTRSSVRLSILAGGGLFYGAFAKLYISKKYD